MKTDKQTMTAKDFEQCMTELRPRLHRYCARMTGSTVDGEDVLQEALIKALQARAEGIVLDNPGGWMFRIAHNASMDFLRQRARRKVVPMTEDMEDEAAPMPEADVVAVGFHTFLQLPELQRCAVILKDVLGHSVEEIAQIADCTPAAAKSALQRGRLALRQLAAQPGELRLPLISEADRRKLSSYVQLFQGGDFDAIRALLAEDVKLDLVNRLKLEGRTGISRYFTRYEQETKWRYAFGAVEGRPAMLVFDQAGPTEKPAHFVLLDWQGDEIVAIRDFLFASYTLEGVDWVRLG